MLKNFEFGETSITNQMSHHANLKKYENIVFSVLKIVLLDLIKAFQQ